MTKEDILHHFQDINFYYNDCGMYDDLSRMLDELIAESKGDLISRQVAIDAFERFIHELGIKDEPYNYGEMALSAQNVPSAENKGEWIKIQSGDKDFPESIVCSKCKNENSHLDFNEHAEPIGKVFVTSKFCPNCGADMRGKAE